MTQTTDTVTDERLREIIDGCEGVTPQWSSGRAVDKLSDEPTDGFAASDFADVAARMVKFDLDTDQYQAVMSNCFNVILAALNRAALRTSPPASPTEAGEAS